MREINGIKISDSYWLTGTGGLTHQGLKDLGKQIWKVINGYKKFFSPFL